MSDALSGLDPSSLSYLRVGTEWVDVQVLSDPFVIYGRYGYTPVILVEALSTESRHLLFVSANSLAECLEPMRLRRGALVGLNMRVRKKGEDKYSRYEVEELAD
jgi:hypothetical protein